MLALSYGFIFKPDQAVGLVDYNRYIYTYYIGWFFMALACWSTALQTADGEQKARPATGLLWRARPVFC